MLKQMNKKAQVKRIFDSIAGKYDLLNHLLSLGIDIYWRKRALKLTGINKNSILLDVACGTGDFAISAYKVGVRNIICSDFSLNMLNLFTKKAEWVKGNLFQATAESLPIKNNIFTNITVAFGVRNFYDIQKAFDVFCNVLLPGGKVTILEFRLPSQKVLQSLYNLYFSNVLPKIGKIISKDKEAYTYLPESVHEFDTKINLPELLRNSGFNEIETYSLTAGIVQVVIATK